MKALKIRKVGNSLGVILPKEMLAELGLGEGDELVAIKEGQRAFSLTASEPELARQLEIARKGMTRYRRALAELAK